jgi:hypothetical protein
MMPTLKRHMRLILSLRDNLSPTITRRGSAITAQRQQSKSNIQRFTAMQHAGYFGEDIGSE